MEIHVVCRVGGVDTTVPSGKETLSRSEHFQKGVSTISTEDNKALVRRAFEDLNQGSLGKADEYFTPNFVFHDAANPQVSNSEEYMQFLTGLMAALPGQFTIEDMIAEGDKVVSHYTFRSTHRGQWRGIPPTCKPVTITSTATYRFADGKVAEMWQNADTLGLLQQLGVIPSMGQASYSL
jgi:predicted ester cyclase